MVDIVKQLCIKSHTVTDSEGTSFTVKQGQKYTTTVPKKKEKNVTVFSQYWVPAPKKNFVKVESE